MPSPFECQTCFKPIEATIPCDFTIEHMTLVLKDVVFDHDALPAQWGCPEGHPVTPEQRKLLETAFAAATTWGRSPGTGWLDIDVLHAAELPDSPTPALGAVASGGGAVSPVELEEIDRESAIVRIREGLAKRSSKAWSVTHGRGTTSQWLTITSPPKRRNGSSMTEEDSAELARLLGIPTGAVHHQGVMVRPTKASRNEYVDRAEGRPPRIIAPLD